MSWNGGDRSDLNPKDVFHRSCGTSIIRQSYTNCRIAFVDDISLYTRKLIEGCTQKGGNCVLYGPRRSPRSKPPGVLEKPGPGTSPVWTQNGFPFQIFRKATKDRPRFLHFQFEFYGIHSYGPLYTSLWLPITLLLLRPLYVKTIVTLHMVLPRDRNLELIRDTAPGKMKIPTSALAIFLIWWYKTVSVLSSRMIVHANVFKTRLERSYNINPSKIAVIPHGVETFIETAFEPKQTRALEPKPILYFGVISPRKGLETLLAAYAFLRGRRKDVPLLLAGTTPPYYKGYDDKVKTLAGHLNVDTGMRFLGKVSTKRAHQLFKSAQFLVLPYSYDMSASGSLSWALGHGIPVVASGTDYFAEEISHEEFGILVQPGEPQVLADAMAKMLEEETSVKRFAENSRRLGLERSWVNIAEKTLTLYETLVAEEGPHTSKRIS
jgi:glycosyltransferase involved in cell wall biosynthesis